MLLVSLALFLSDPLANPVLVAGDLVDSRAAIEEWTGSMVILSPPDLPLGLSFDTMFELAPAEREVALSVLSEVIRQYPKGLFASIALNRIGILGACGDAKNDGFRPWVEAVNGYRYFGLQTAYGILVCRYNDSQMIHTFHHEAFHHIESVAIKTGMFPPLTIEQDHQRFERAITSVEPYSPLRFDDNTMALLREASTGLVLEDAVTVYAQKSPGEDKAETAFWFQTHLADALLQAALRPELPGSQRILHILHLYQRASPELTLAWWLGVIRDQVLADARSESPTRF